MMKKRRPVSHELKTWPEFYTATIRGEKRFEVRKNDRDFQVGDVLLLQEYDWETHTYTKREFTLKVLYIMAGGQHGIAPDYVVMGIIPHYGQIPKRKVPLQ